MLMLQCNAYASIYAWIVMLFLELKIFVTPPANHDNLLRQIPCKKLTCSKLLTKLFHKRAQASWGSITVLFSKEFGKVFEKSLWKFKLRNIFTFFQLFHPATEPQGLVFHTRCTKWNANDKWRFPTGGFSTGNLEFPRRRQKAALFL